MLFGGKTEQLKAELTQLKEADSQKAKALEEISKQKDVLEERFASLAISNAQMQKDLEVANENIRQLLEAAEGNQTSSERIGQAVSEAVEQVKTAGTGERTFLEAMKEQNAQIEGVVEQNKHFTTPIKVFMDFPIEYTKEEMLLKEKLEQMADLSKNMSVLSLNAAIEAGRMGEAGRNFIAAAEEVRTFSEEYAKAATEAFAMLTGMNRKINILEEQAGALNELLKNNNISMGKILNEQSKQISDYEARRMDVSELISEEAVKETETLLQAEKQVMDFGGRLSVQLQEMKNEYTEQKNCTDELEAIFQKISRYMEVEK